MRIIVMSDSHGNFNRVRKIVEDNMATAQTFIHLGDGLDEFDDVHLLYPDLHFVSVKGNNDWGSNEQKARKLSMGGKKLLLAHGDLHRVKFGLLDFQLAARDARVDIGLYGHTHYSAVDYIDGLYLINPGSVGGGYGAKATYLALDIAVQGIVPVIRDIV